VGFVGQHVVKHVTNEQGERLTIYGTVEEVFHTVINLHGNDPVQKVQFTIDYGYHKNCDLIYVNTMSEYVMNYCSAGQDDPFGDGSRCENPRNTHQQVVNL
jgi:hypothetical protein